MPRLIFYNRIFCPSAMMSYHAEVVPPCVLSKGKDSMSCPTSSDRVYFPMAMITCYANVVKSCKLSKMMMGCHGRRSLVMCANEGR